MIYRREKHFCCKFHDIFCNVTKLEELVCHLSNTSKGIWSSYQ
jgi:hypothetical protein